LTLSHQGRGIPWATVSLRAVSRSKQAMNAGLRVEKSVRPVSQKTPGQWSVGDMARVTLTLYAPNELSWVALQDPVPSGSSIMGKGLGGESQLARIHEVGSRGARPASIERGSNAFRAYYSRVPGGTWSIDYTIRLNQAGQFELPATRAEAMYAPEIFGELPNEAWHIQPVEVTTAEPETAAAH
jgi:uncharacterized protein YfaS (alpha-2-macroglobulin family)